jgi:hypothetical protein
MLQRVIAYKNVVDVDRNSSELKRIYFDDTEKHFWSEVGDNSDAETYKGALIQKFVGQDVEILIDYIPVYNQTNKFDLQEFRKAEALAKLLPEDIEILGLDKND